MRLFTKDTTLSYHNKTFSHIFSFSSKYFTSHKQKLAYSKYLLYFCRQIKNLTQRLIKTEK